MKTLSSAALTLFLSLPVLAQVPTTLTLTIDEAAADRAAGTIPARATLTNVTDDSVPGLTLYLASGADIVALESSWSCTNPYTSVVCTRASLAPRESVVLDFLIRIPQRAGRVFISANATYTQPGGPYFAGNASGSAAMFRPFTVTNTNDAGEGSLRAAILAVNADTDCATLPCRIEFAIRPAAQNLWHTIIPLTPLPTVVAGDVEIDATLQSDSNPLGPDVELWGTAIAQGNGLYIRAERMAVRGLSIGGFPDNGILYFPTIRGSIFRIEKNHIGVDPTGAVPVPNGARGITIAEGIVRESFIRDNVISSNVRSGVFLVTQLEPGLPLSPVLFVLRNTITGNGASGIFVGPNAQQVSISDNVIEHNAHFGIAIARTATWIQIGANRIFDHPLPAIDIGLDGATGASLIESARYDAATDTTTITGRAPGGNSATYRLLFYANDTVDASGYAEAEQLLGTVTTSTGATFSLQMKGDLRGRWVNATITEILNLDGSLFYRSGETLRAIRVE